MPRQKMPRKPRIQAQPDPETQNPSAFHAAVRWLVLAFAFSLPFYYDPHVPEVAGDLRWTATIFFAGLCTLLLAAGALHAGSVRLNLRWPPAFWLGLGLFAWAALSLADAVNWMRGLVPLKALAAQLTLMAVVYLVATPVFLRRLMWALALPLAFTSALGIVQFHNWYVPGIAGDIADLFKQSAPPGSTFANKNIAASWTAMLVPVVLYLLVGARRWYGQAAAAALLALAGVFLLYTRTRASWIALLAGLMTLAALVVLVPAWRRAVLERLDLRRAAWLLLPAAALLAWGGDVSSRRVDGTLGRSPVQQMQALLPAGAGGLNDGGRTAYNLNSAVIVRDHWFNGAGIGNWFTIYPAYHEAVVATPEHGYNVALRPHRAHSDFAQAFAELGIPGGLLYAGFFACAIAMAFALAGARAGALGCMLVAAGVLSALLALAVYFEYRAVFALPGPWNRVLQGALGLAVALLLFGSLRQARALRGETAAADDSQLLGMMAGIAVLTICVNALMDFPMQLPTAPAAAALLIGAIASAYANHRPQALAGPAWSPRLGRLALSGGLAAATALWGLLLYDAWKLREASSLLKAAMLRANAGVNDRVTLQTIEAALNAYPLDPRVHDELGVIYTHYKGLPDVAAQIRIAKLERVVAGDPWGANHLINLSSLYMKRAESLRRTNVAEAEQEADRALARVEELFARLRRAAGASHLTWTVGGTLKLLQNRPQEAIELLKKALAINPEFPPAQRHLAMAVEMAKRKP